MMTRQCDACGRLISQLNDEYLELSIRVLDATENEMQGSKCDPPGGAK